MYGLDVVDVDSIGGGDHWLGSLQQRHHVGAKYHDEIGALDR